MARDSKVFKLALCGIFTAIIIAMSVVPFLGYIPLGFMNATIIHVPVIIGAILMGPSYGAFLGFVFGMTSLIKATLTPDLTSFVFSPFVTIGGNKGNIFSVVIAIVPRVLIGVTSYYAFKGLSRLGLKRILALWISGIAGSMTNTFLVMNGIYLFFGERYVAASGGATEYVYRFILGIIVSFGIPEAIIAGLLTAAIAGALLKFMK